MSTENTQTDVTPSGDVTESNVANTGSELTDTQSQASGAMTSVDDLKKAAKDSASPSETADPLKKEAAQVAAESLANKFSPNFKYKAALQEKEIEEFWRPLIKDADSEKKVKDFLQKIDGFDFVKQSREKLDGQYKALEQDYTAQTQLVNRVTGAVQNKDYGSAFRQLGISDEDIFRYTQSRLQRLEMPPEQRKAFEDAESLREQQTQMQEQMSQYQKLYEEQVVQARTMQLDYVMSKPDVMGMAQNWDNLQGTPGAFRDLVIQEAQTAYFQKGLDLSAEQAVQLVMQKFGKVLSTGGGSAQEIASQAQSSPSQTPQVRAPQAKPVIPNINGKGASPIKKVPKSLDDLKRMAKDLQSQDQLI